MSQNQIWISMDFSMDFLTYWIGTLEFTLLPSLRIFLTKIKHGYMAVRDCGVTGDWALRWGGEHSRHGTVAVLRQLRLLQRWLLHHRCYGSGKALLELILSAQILRGWNFAFQGTHVVCAIMTNEFLTFTKSKGNDLSTPHPEMQVILLL